MARRTQQKVSKPTTPDDYHVIWDNRGHVVSADEWREWVAAGCPLTAAERAQHHEPRQPAKRDEHGRKVPNRATPTVRYHRNGKPVTDSMNKLSSLSYYFTYRVLSPDSRRMTCPEFRARLAEAGITEPETTEWTYDVGNGNVISTTIEGSN